MEELPICGRNFFLAYGTYFRLPYINVLMYYIAPVICLPQIDKDKEQNRGQSGAGSPTVQ